MAAGCLPDPTDVVQRPVVGAERDKGLPHRRPDIGFGAVIAAGVAHRHRVGHPVGAHFDPVVPIFEIRNGRVENPVFARNLEEMCIRDRSRCRRTNPGTWY